MTNHGNMYGPAFTFLGIPSCDLDDPSTYKGADVIIVGAPIDSGTSHRSGAKFGPQAIRGGDYLPHDGSRPHLAIAIHRGKVKISMIHFDAHADTGEDQFGALVGHGTPMRNLINNGYVRGDRFLQLGLRGYWPEDATLNWMRDQGMRSYEMTEIHHRGLKEVLDESFATLTNECDGVFLSVDIDVVDPGMAPGTGTPEPGGMTSRELLEAVRRICLELPIVGIDVVEVAPPFDNADITAILANRVVLEALSAIAKRRSGSSYNPTQNLLDR